MKTIHTRKHIKKTKYETEYKSRGVVAGDMVIITSDKITKKARAKLVEMNFEHVSGASKGKSWWVWNALPNGDNL